MLPVRRAHFGAWGAGTEDDMSEAKRTPGLWIMEHLGHTVRVVVNSDGEFGDALALAEGGAK